MNNKKQISFEGFKGKKILIVNTASDCGYTPQYKELQQLYDQHKNNLEIIAFPANEFKEQEKKDDASIAEFCEINYGVDFLLAAKSSVRKNEDQNQVFQWLSNPEKNGWNKRAPVWNFCKYLINEEGVLTHFFGPSVSPLGKEILTAIND